MNTFAWVLILAAILIGRAVYKGRVFNMGEDLSDSFLALINNDTAKLKEVLDRTGDTNTAAQTDLNLFKPAFDSVVGVGVGVAGAAAQGIDQIERYGNNSVALASVVLGGKAKGYRWGATGPDYYDCSGLIWQAMKLAKAYTGGRFTTATFPSKIKGTYTKVNATAEVEDIVVWPFRVPYTTGHMGVVTGPNKFYSARSVTSGIGETSISGFRKDKPDVWRRTKFPHPDSVE